MSHLTIRYSIFIEKGIKISIRSHLLADKDFVSIQAGLPKIKRDGVIPEFKNKLICEDVSVYFNVGVHDKYLFPGEHNSNPAENKKLTKDYGIYIICNDRVIVANSFDKKYGFMTSTHSEYNGFVCYVRMVAENPAKLPWNTTKTEIKVYSPLFIEAKKPIESLASKYRSQAKSVIKAWRSEDNKETSEEEKRKAFYEKLGVNFDSLKEIDNDSIQVGLFDEHNDSNEVKPIEDEEKVKPTGKGKKRKLKPKPRPEENLDRDRDIFVNWPNCNISIPQNRKKEYEILVDMCRLSSKETPIACMVMLRVFLETTLKQVIASMDLEWQNLNKCASRVVDGLYNSDYIDEGLKELVTQFSRTDGDLFSIKNIQSMVHSTKFHPSQSVINAYWDQLEPFLAACWKFISDKDKNMGD